METDLTKALYKFDVPAHMHASIIRYVENRIQPGSFLTAVFANDLMAAFGKADESNAAAMQNYTRFIYNVMPIDSHGSYETVKEWLLGRCYEETTL